MKIELTRKGNIIHIKVIFPRIDGENFIIDKLLGEGLFLKEIELLEIDLGNVEYLNSLGITEFVNIHRKYKEISQGKTPMRLINVDRKIQAIFELVEVQNIAEIILKPHSH